MFRKNKGSKQSPEAKKRQERQMYLAKEDPHPSIDLSECELSQFPEGLFALVKILRKETFVVRVNSLSSFEHGGKLTDLYLLQSFDLSENSLHSLPADFGSALVNLKSLNLRENKLESLPKSFGQLRHLAQLNLQANRLKEFPSCLVELERLKALDIQKNEKVTKIPPGFSQRCETLTTLFLDAANMKFPDSLVCAEGIESIMRALCSAAGRPYCPPRDSGVDDALEEDDETTTMRKKALEESRIAEGHMEERRRFFEDKEEQKRQDALRSELEYREMQKRELQAVAQSQAEKVNLVEDIEREEGKVLANLEVILEKRDKDRLNLMTSVKDAEDQVNGLIASILETNERAKLIEAIMDKAERDRVDLEDYYKVKVEEAAFLRQKDVIESMRQLELLHNDDQMLAAYEKYEREREITARRTLDEMVQDERQVDRAVDRTLKEREQIMANCFEEVEFQRMAYEKLVMDKDSKHERLRKEIGLIEDELMNLTLLEIQRKAVKAESDKKALAEHRSALTAVLLQLIDEKGKREKELKNRLIEMEDQREDSIKQYWLIQYQRLMDRKPQSLMDEEYSQLEAVVASLLKEAGANSFLTLFATNRITIETMLTLTDGDLAEIGVDDVGVRKAILKQIETYRDEKDRAEEKTRRLEMPVSGDLTVRLPSAPSSPEMKKKTWKKENRTETATTITNDERGAAFPGNVPNISNATVPSTSFKIHHQTECVVCLNAAPNVIFLPCGHVCCCNDCVEPIKECPLCRQELAAKLLLGAGTRVVVD